MWLINCCGCSTASMTAARVVSISSTSTPLPSSRPPARRMPLHDAVDGHKQQSQGAVATEQAAFAPGQAPDHRPPAPRRRSAATASCCSASAPSRRWWYPRRAPRRPSCARATTCSRPGPTHRSPISSSYGSTDVVFSPYGEQWRQVKKIATTHLFTNRKVRSYRHACEQEVRLVMAKIREAAATSTAVDLSDLLNSFANDVVCHAVSGKFFREEGRNKLLQELIEVNSSLMGGFNLEDYFPALVRVGMVKRMVCAKAHKMHKMWDDLLEKLLDGRASKPSTDESDFIDVLLSIQQEYNLTRDHIKAQLMVMFEAGTDTTFIVLEYAMAELMRNPHRMTKLQTEVRVAVPKEKEMVNEEDLCGMTYLKAVLKETHSDSTHHHRSLCPTFPWPTAI